MDIFTGRITEVKPLYTQFEPGSALLVHVAGEAKRKTDIIHTAEWGTLWQAFDEKGVLIGSDIRKHSTAPWTTVDTAFDSFTLACGKVPALSFNIRIKLSATPGTLPATPFWTFLDDQYAPISVFGSVVSPSPIPFSYPTPLPSPAPKPAPTPIPIPTPTPTLPGLPGLPGLPELKAEWLIPIALVAVVGILLIPKGKPKPKGKK